MSIANRVTILKLGLNDRSAAVTCVVQDKLIPGWVNAMDGSLFNLLRGLDVEGCSEIASQVVNVWLKTLNYKEICCSLATNDNHLVPIEALKPEMALYWRAAITFLHKEGVHAAEALETILPEMTAFGRYIKDYVTVKLKEADDMQVTIFSKLNVRENSQKSASKQFLNQIHSLHYYLSIVYTI